MNIYYHNRIRSGVVLQDLIRAFTYIYYIILVTVNVGIYIYGLGRLASIHLF